MQGHPRWTAHGGEFWKHVIHWRREWQTIPVHLLWEPHELYKKAKRYATERCHKGEQDLHWKLLLPYPIPNLKGWMLWPHSCHLTAWCEIRTMTGLTTQRQSRVPGVWSRQAAETNVNVYWVALQEQAVARCWILGRQMLGQSTQWSLLQQEHPGSAHSTLDSWAPDLGKTGPGKSLPQRQPRSQVAEEPFNSYNTTPWSPNPAYSTPQLYTRSGADTTEKGKWPWAASESNHGCWHKRCIMRPHGAYLLQQSPPLRQGTYSRTTEPDSRQPSGFLLQ